MSPAEFARAATSIELGPCRRNSVESLRIAKWRDERDTQCYNQCDIQEHRLSRAALAALDWRIVGTRAGTLCPAPPRPVLPLPARAKGRGGGVSNGAGARTSACVPPDTRESNERVSVAQ